MKKVKREKKSLGKKSQCSIHHMKNDFVCVCVYTQAHFNAELDKLLAL